MGKPISEKHAIDVASFIVVFERPFETHIIESLPGLHERLKADYPSFSPTTTLQVNITENAINQNIGTVAGGVLQNIREDGRPIWTLRIEGNTIIVSCNDYKRWGDISAKALAHIGAAIAFVKNDGNAVSSLIHQIVDRFVTVNKDEYDIKQVFNSQSSYLTGQALKAGKFWHIFQGWFDEKQELGGKLLNVLNLSTADNPANITTTIDHAVHLRFELSKAIEELDDKFIRKTFDALHETNKSIIKNLLNPEQLKTIGITQ
ncbi:MAG: TIGR04255 family protein [Gallionella sp.]